MGYKKVLLVFLYVFNDLCIVIFQYLQGIGSRPSTDTKKKKKKGRLLDARKLGKRGREVTAYM